MINLLQKVYTLFPVLGLRIEVTKKTDIKNIIFFGV